MSHEYTPDRKWSWNEYLGHDENDNIENEVVTMTEKEILDEYYTFWSVKMRQKYGDEHFEEHYSFGDCVEDYIIVNWAYRA